MESSSKVSGVSHICSLDTPFLEKWRPNLSMSYFSFKSMRVRIDRGLVRRGLWSDFLSRREQNNRTMKKHARFVAYSTFFLLDTPFSEKRRSSQSVSYCLPCKSAWAYAQNSVRADAFVSSVEWAKAKWSEHGKRNQGTWRFQLLLAAHSTFQVTTLYFINVVSSALESCACLWIGVCVCRRSWLKVWLSSKRRNFDPEKWEILIVVASHSILWETMVQPINFLSFALQVIVCVKAEKYVQMRVRLEFVSRR